MIPECIRREHILEAMARIDREGVTPGRNGLKFAVWHQHRQYPPKLVISLAHEVATGRALPSAIFSGGSETNSFLQDLGFTVRGLDGTTVAASPRGSRSRAAVSMTRLGHHEDVEEALRAITESRPLYWWRDLAQNKELPPRVGGVYGWFFKGVPRLIHADGCIRRGEMTLLYLGISPESLGSGASLRTRIRYHYLGNAEGSTLRRSLGCVLEGQLGTVLHRVGSGGRRTFGPKEAQLTQWMAENAAVTWVETAEPWLLEEALISRLPLPLNIEMNGSHPFCAQLRQLRLQARLRADRSGVIKG